MKIIRYKEDIQKQTTAFFRSIFADMGWEEWESDHLDDPKTCFNLPHNGVLLLLITDGEIIGSGGFLKLNSQEGLIKRFYVAKDYRGKGSAQVMLHALLAEATKMNLSRLVLDVSNNNKRAIRFYEKSGFTPFSPPPNDIWWESKTPQEFKYFYIDVEKAQSLKF